MRKITAVLFYALFVLTVFVWLTNIAQTLSCISVLFFLSHDNMSYYTLEHTWMNKAGFLICYVWAIFVIGTPVWLTARAFKKMDVAQKAAFLYMSAAFVFSVGVIWHYISFTQM